MVGAVVSYKTPAAPGGTTTFLRADGSYAAPALSVAATQAQQEAATDNTVDVTPANQQWHPSAAKFWCMFDGTGTPAIIVSYNMTSLADNGTGDYTLTIATDFSSASWCPFGFVSGDAVSQTLLMLGNVRTTDLAAGTIRVKTESLVAAVDRTLVCVGGFGDL